MPKTRRQKKMRGGGEGTIDISWAANGKKRSAEIVFDTLTGENVEDDALDNVKSAVEQHVRSANYKTAEIDKTLQVVDVTYDGEKPAAPGQFSFDLTSTSGKTIKLSATFSQPKSAAEVGPQSLMGGKKSRRRRRRQSRRRA